MLLDFVDVVVHVQHAEERAFYALERLWKDCPTIPFVDAAAPVRPDAGSAPTRRSRPVTAGDEPAIAGPPGARLAPRPDRWNAEGRFQGQLDPPLDAVGPRPGRSARLRAAGRLPAADTVVVSSDLVRAAETAERPDRLLGIPLRRDARLRELGLGSWQGLTRAGRRRTPPGAVRRLARRAARAWPRVGGAGAVAHRALAALADLPAVEVAVA